MGKSQETFSKKEKEKKRIKKRQDKLLKAEERKANSKGGAFEDMIAYVDENGHLTDTPPDPTKKVVIEVENIEISIPKKEDVYEDPIKKGRIEFFNTDKGYGFIKELDTNEKFFVHANGLTEEVFEGDKVLFELEKGLKGLNAVRVKKVDTFV